jgi:hypothetical protein
MTYRAAASRRASLKPEVPGFKTTVANGTELKFSPHQSSGTEQPIVLRLARIGAPVAVNHSSREADDQLPGSKKDGKNSTIVSKRTIKCLTKLLSPCEETRLIGIKSTRNGVRFAYTRDLLEGKNFKAGANFTLASQGETAFVRRVKASFSCGSRDSAFKLTIDFKSRSASGFHQEAIVKLALRDHRDISNVKLRIGSHGQLYLQNRDVAYNPKKLNDIFSTLVPGVRLLVEGKLNPVAIQELVKMLSALDNKALAENLRQARQKLLPS